MTTYVNKVHHVTTITQVAKDLGIDAVISPRVRAPACFCSEGDHAAVHADIGAGDEGGAARH